MTNDFTLRPAITATPTDDPERQDLAIGGIPIGAATLNARGTEWTLQPITLGFTLDIATLRALADTLDSLPRPSREAMETFYRAKGYLAEGEHLDEVWGQPEPHAEVTAFPHRPYTVSQADGTVTLRATDDVIGSVKQGPGGWHLDSHLPLDYCGAYPSKREAAQELFDSYLRFLTQDEHNRPVSPKDL